MIFQKEFALLVLTLTFITTGFSSSPCDTVLSLFHCQNCNTGSWNLQIAWVCHVNLPERNVFHAAFWVKHTKLLQFRVTSEKKKSFISFTRSNNLFLKPWKSNYFKNPCSTWIVIYIPVIVIVRILNPPEIALWFSLSLLYGFTQLNHLLCVVCVCSHGAGTCRAQYIFDTEICMFTWSDHGDMTSINACKKLNY